MDILASRGMTILGLGSSGGENDSHWEARDAAAMDGRRRIDNSFKIDRIMICGILFTVSLISTSKFEVHFNFIFLPIPSSLILHIGVCMMAIWLLIN